MADDPHYTATQDRSEFNVLFVHSALDDAGLSASEFRVYCHIARRSGNTPSVAGIESMASVCRLNPKTVREALATLEERKMLAKKERPGRTTLWRLTKRSEWVPAFSLESDPSQTSTGHPSQTSTGHPSQTSTGHPSQTRGDEGNTYEGNTSQGCAPSARSRNILLETLIEVCGGNLKETTKAAWAAAATALKDIKAVASDLTPEELDRRASNYAANNPEWALTPSALAKNWGTCGTRISHGRKTNQASERKDLVVVRTADEECANDAAFQTRQSAIRAQIARDSGR